MESITYPYNIPFSNKKLFLLILAALTFVGLGVWLLFFEQSGDGRFPQWVGQVIGGLNILFFGVCAVVGFKFFNSKKMALTIDDEGVRDQSSAVATGLIKWEDITGFRVYQVMTTKMILVDVKNPDEYIDRARGTLAKKAMEQNVKMVGTPVSINSSTLKISTDNILKLLNEELAFQRQLASGPGTPLPELIRMRNELGR